MPDPTPTRVAVGIDSRECTAVIVRLIDSDAGEPLGSTTRSVNVKNHDPRAWRETWISGTGGKVHFGSRHGQILQRAPLQLARGSFGEDW
jgi:photosystem II stability/assembly factor-like uncharacterized protein